MHLHGRSLAKVYDEVGMDVLPAEYLPDDYEGTSVGTCENIVGTCVQSSISNINFTNYPLWTLIGTLFFIMYVSHCGHFGCVM